MDSILFEKQEAALCAQHALNMLLQSELFSVQELTEIARRLDRQENSMLEENSQNKESQNMNDSGYFSIQVISESLKAFDLEIHNIEHPSMAEMKTDPLRARAFLCNYEEHWFVLRKFGKQWFELNSIKVGPKLLSDTYLDIFLHQLSAEGYSIFVVMGILPESEADQLIGLCPVEPPPVQENKKPNMIQKFFNSVGRRLGGAANEENREDGDLAIAMAMSMENTNDAELEAAIRASMENVPSNSSETPILSQADEVRRKREAFLKKFEEQGKMSKPN